MYQQKSRVSTGIASLDRRLESLFIGDNVIWYDEAGSLAFTFCLNFIKASREEGKPLVYITFDRSPKALLEELGPLALSGLTILDCFTYGKGDGSEVFVKFYNEPQAHGAARLIKVEEPANPRRVAESIYAVHRTLSGDVRFVFESLTGMQDLWGSEEQIAQFYSRSCPRLYELDTIAYWLIEKGAHSTRLKAHINQIAQVAIELNLKRGKSSLSILKAHNRRPDTLGKPELYWTDGLKVAFDSDEPLSGKLEFGLRLKTLRARQNMAQKELAGLIGVTPSTISQIEGNLIYPSLPALFKMAQALGVDVGYFFQKSEEPLEPAVFPGGGEKVVFPDLPKEALTGWQLLPINHAGRTEPYLLEIPPGRKLSRHFFIFKGEEFGYLLQGRLQVRLQNKTHHLSAGDVIHLTTQVPTQWKNPGDEPARLLWVKIS